MSEVEVRASSVLAQQDPGAEVEWASRCAKTLVQVIKGNPQLVVKIGKGEYIKVEGWQTLGAMTKVDHVEVVWCREYHKPRTEVAIGWEARVEVKDREGNMRGSGEAMCTRDEKRWADADEYAIRSMAQTRAMGKAYRMALSYVVALAGYEATPAEEMPLPEALQDDSSLPTFGELEAELHALMHQWQELEPDWKIGAGQQEMEKKSKGQDGAYRTWLNRQIEGFNGLIRDKAKSEAK